MRLVFAGTPDFAAHTLAALIASEFEVVAVYCQPDRPKGRGKQLIPPPTKQLALEHNIPVYQPLNFKGQTDRDQLAALQPDVMVVVAYGLLLPQSVLDIPRLGCINVHASLLPRWRGAAPIERAIEAGDAETGVTIMQMDAGLDTGPMLHKVPTPIYEFDDGETLASRLAEIGTDALLTVLRSFDHYKSHAEPQPVNVRMENSTTNARADIISAEISAITYAQKFDKDQAQINWKDDADIISRRIRAFFAREAMYSNIGEMRVKIYRADQVPIQGEPGTILRANKKGILVACGNNAINITKLQLPGGKILDAAAALNSHTNAAIFGEGHKFEWKEANGQ